MQVFNVSKNKKPSSVVLDGKGVSLDERTS
jgi:hypothetical protein